MEIEGPVPHVQERGRDDLPVIGEDEELRIEGKDRGDRLWSAQALGRKDRLDPRSPSDVGDGRARELLLAPGRTGRRGHDPDELDDPCSRREPLGVAELGSDCV